MTITPHLLAGSALAVATTDNIAVAFLIGFFLHFLIDAIPHVDPGTFFNVPENNDKSWPLWIYIFAVSEFVVAWGLIILLFQHKTDFGIIMFGALGGIAVDVLDNNPFRTLRTLPVIKQIHWLHKKLHFDLSYNKWYWGMPTQIIFIGASLWYLLKF